MILKTYPTPDKILRSHRKTMIEKIIKASRKGEARATIIYEKLMEAAHAAKIFGSSVDSVFFTISINLEMIDAVNKQVAFLMERMHDLIEEHHYELFIKQIELLQTIPGVGFLSAVTVMCEIGDFSSFNNPKQLFAYFGLALQSSNLGNSMLLMCIYQREVQESLGEPYSLSLLLLFGLIVMAFH